MYYYTYTIHDLIHGYTWMVWVMLKMLKMHIAGCPRKSYLSRCRWCISPSIIVSQGSFAMLSIQTFPGSRVSTPAFFKKWRVVPFGWWSLPLLMVKLVKPPTGPLKDGGNSRTSKDTCCFGRFTDFLKLHVSGQEDVIWAPLTTYL